MVLWEGHRSWWFGGVESGARDDPELPLLNVLKRLLAQPESLCGDADAHLCFEQHAVWLSSAGLAQIDLLHL